MKCLILAAGRGSRLSDKGQPKPLVSFLGLPLVERAILTARASGIREFYVVTGFQGEKVREFLDTLQDKHRISIAHIINDEWEKENGVSVLKARHKISAPFLLMMCDHVVSTSMVERLLQEGVEPGGVSMGVDFALQQKAPFVLEEATKVQVREGKVVSIGKDIKDFQALDTGLFLCSEGIFEALAESSGRGDTTLSGGIRVLASKGKAKAVAMEGLWFDIDDERSLKKAETAFLNSLKKPTDGPVSRYINRPLSIRITKLLVERDITPNTISLASFFMCLMGAVCFVFKSYALLLLGGMLAQAASIVDGCDGEVARVKFMETEFGAWFDAVLDRYADALLLTGLSLHCLWYHPPWLVFLLGSAAISGSLINSYTADKYDGFMKRRLAARPGRNGKPGYFRVGRDIRMMVIFLGALLDLALFTLLVLGVGMNLENARRVWLLYGHGNEAA